MTQVSFLQNPQDMHAQQKKNIHLGNKTLCENKFTLELRHVNIVFFHTGSTLGLSVLGWCSYFCQLLHRKISEVQLKV